MNTPKTFILKRAAATIALAALSIAPALAAVKTVQGVTVGGTVITVTSQREIYAVAAPDRPARRLGRLPRHTSPLVSDGTAAWAVTTGTRKAPSLRVFRVQPTTQAVLEYSPRTASMEGRVTVEGIAGADSRYVYLIPDLRLDLESESLETGHLPAHPELTVVRVIRDREDTVYLARDRDADPEAGPRLWLLRSNGTEPRSGAESRPDAQDWLKVEAGRAAGRVEVQRDPQSVFVVFEEGRILRFDGRSLRLAEDLSPMLRPGTIRFFAVEPDAYWVGQGGGEGGGVSIWKIDRDVLDGAAFHAGDVPEGFTPLDAGLGRIWYGATEASHPRPLVSVSQADGSSQSYAIRGLHARHWVSFGYGVARVPMVALAATGIALAIVTLPLWIWFAGAC